MQRLANELGLDIVVHLLLILMSPWACGQRKGVVHMSIGCRRRAFAPDSLWRAIAERLMKAALVVEGQVFADTGFRLAAVGIAPQIDVLVFSERPTRSMNTLSSSVRARLSRCARRPLIQHAGEAEPVNWLPWSVLKISGLPYRASASSSATTQKDASIAFDFRQDRTARLAQSMTATKWKKARPIGM